MRTALVAFWLVASLATSGCSIAGAAVGAEMPRYERSDWQRSNVELGTQIRVRMRNVGADAVVVDAIYGRYGGIHDDLLSVTDEAGRERELPVRDIVDVDVRSGTQWKKGLLIGAAADAIVTVTVLAIANGANVLVMTGP